MQQQNHAGAMGLTRTLQNQFTRLQVFDRAFEQYAVGPDRS
jgi:hypothetical protein